ncbi:hypothetical protein CVT25_004609 [Psilocybe cyanescens]|uniref:F-box domain-containing protein n=1 Tax=Psilocybe cyanescens TaxID=93625 RepID=A0A409VS65_PSICY|nr:hypothetical protein CVT25_004609 [Psilocybe cyanescens]
MLQNSSGALSNAGSDKRIRQHSVSQDATVTIQPLIDHFGIIPIEIFIEIVKMVVHETHSSPLPISHVSKKWQDVIHKSPFLWDSLVLTNRRPAAKVEFWMARTLGKLRELSIRRQAATKARMESWTRYLEPVRWETLRILKVERWPVVEYISRIGKVNALVNLEVLEIDRANSLDSFRLIQNSLDSSLRHLTILSTHPRSFRTPLQVRNLTTLTLIDVNVPSGYFCDLLSANPLLEHLSLEGVRYDGIKKYITLLHLKSLHLCRYFYIPVHGLKMPALEVFRIDRPSAMMRATNFLRRFASSYSSAHLTEIVFSSCRDYFCSYGLISLLRTSPNLQSLEVSYTPSQEVTFVIEFLSTPYYSSLPQANAPELQASGYSNLPPQSPVCPNLTHVNFSGCPGAETGPIMRMVKSRLTVIDNGKQFGWDGQSPPPLSRAISSLVIDYCPQIDPAWVSWLLHRVPSVSYVLSADE